MMRRILYYTESFCNPSETFVYRIAHCFRDYQPVVFTHQRIHKSQYPDRGLPIVETPHRRYTRILRLSKFIINSLSNSIPSSDLLGKSQLNRLHQKYSYSLIFAHFAPCGIRSLPSAQLLQLPLITMFHGCDLSNWLQFPFYRVKLHQLFNRGDAFVVATRYMKKKAIDLGCLEEKIHVIPYPVPILLKTPEEKRSQNNRPVRFIHVGRLQEKKGILYSLRAFAKICSIYPDSDFVVIGEGPQRTEAERLSQELEIANKVHFLGSLLFDEVKEELFKADIYVQHSITADDGDTEGFGVSLAEASSSFLPVVATRHNGFPEVILNEKTGFLVPERDIEAMVQGMKRLVESPQLRAQFGRAGHAFVKGRFSNDSVSRAYKSFFDEMIEM